MSLERPLHLPWIPASAGNDEWRGSPAHQGMKMLSIAGMTWSAGMGVVGATSANPLDSGLGVREACFRIIFVPMTDSGGATGSMYPGSVRDMLSYQ